VVACLRWLVVARSAVRSLSRLSWAIACCIGSRADELRAAGVRISGVDALAALMQSSVAELMLDSKGGRDAGAEGSATLVLPGAFRQAPDRVCPPYIPGAGVDSSSRGKPSKLPTWAASTDRFSRGETLASIAVGQDGGRVIQVATVRGHLLKGLVAARASIHLQRLHQECSTAAGGGSISRAQWEALDVAAASTTPPLRLADAAEWGIKGDKAFQLVRQAELLAAVDGGALRALQDTPWSDRSEEQRQTYSAWLTAVDWWGALRRAGVPVRWEDNEGASGGGGR
jgi:hypothetical protein